MTFGIAKAKAAVAAVRSAPSFAKQRCSAWAQVGRAENFAEFHCSADPNCDFIDVGANAGVYAFYALPFFRRVYAVEAHPSLMTHSPHCRTQGAGDAAALRHSGRSQAVDSTAGEGDLYHPVVPGAKAIRDLRCGSRGPSLTTIDALVLEALAVMKIDVEGHGIPGGTRRRRAHPRHGKACLVCRVRGTPRCWRRRPSFCLL